MASFLSALAAAGAGELERHGIAAERVLRQLTVPAGEVLLLDQDGRQGRRDPGVVRRLGLALDAERIGDAARLGEGRVALALGLRGDDLGLALGLDQLVALLLGLLLLDLLGLDRLLVGRVEADVGECRLLQLDPVLVQIGRERLLDLVLDDRPLRENLGGLVGRGVGLEDLLSPRIDDDAGVTEPDGPVDLGRALRDDSIVEHHLHLHRLHVLRGGVVAGGVLLNAHVHGHDVVERVPQDV